VVTAAQRRAVVAHFRDAAAVEGRRVSQRRACRWLGTHRTPVRYVPRRQRDDAGLRQRLRELAAEHPRWGAPMLTWRLRQEGATDNHKRVRRLYRAEGLAVRRRGRKRLAVPRVERPAAAAPNERWAMDFVRDTLSSGRAFRALSVVDTCTRECLAIEVDVGLTGERVAAVLDRAGAGRGLPNAVVCDNGPEFRGRALDVWAAARGVALEFIRPGKPVDNAHIESFNGRLRDECLNSHWFLSLGDARRIIEAWRVAYNTARPHRALGRRPPATYAAQLAATPHPALSDAERT
jgi:putative transposase